MYTAGIVAEFDPFHKGHEYLIKQARERGATHIAVVMSGAAVQRGEIAVCTKHERAELALKCGADLVIELPAPFSCSMAEFFAGGAVHILGQLNIDALCFGSETENADNITAAARAMEDLRDSAELKRYLEQGISYPAAIHAAVKEIYGEKAASVLETPNSTLGAEYVRALIRNGIRADIMPVKRVGAGHDKKGGEYPSGSELREILLGGGDISSGVPAECVPAAVYDPCRADDILLYHLLTACRGELLSLPEVNEAIADRIVKIRRDPPDKLGEFLLSVKTANITLARLRRSALHLTLGVTRKDFAEPPPYIRILAFNERGTEILRRASKEIPVSSSLKTLEENSAAAAHIIAIENRAVRLQQMCRSSGNASPRFENEYTRKIAPKK